jgi:hypothetical protein
MPPAYPSVDEYLERLSRAGGPVGDTGSASLGLATGNSPP